MKEPFLVNPPKAVHVRKRGKQRELKRKSNPIGEALVVIGSNPVRGGGKRMHYFHHRNPVDANSLKGAMNVGHWAPLAITGGLSAVAAGVAPGMLGLTGPWTQLGARLVVAFGGGVAVTKFVGKEHGSVWAVVGLALIAYDLLKRYVLSSFFPQLGLSGVGAYAYPSYSIQDESQVAAFPQAQGMSAYPDNGVAAFPLGGADSYPYDGRYGSYVTDHMYNY